MVLLLDLDHFKRVNDKHGHTAGDAVLKHFASLLAAELRRVDIAARIGGEEFAVLLPDTDCAAALVFARRLRDKVAGAACPDADRLITITVSIGIAAMDANDETLDAALVRADRALYRAKRGGRNRVLCCPQAKESTRKEI